MRVHRFICEHKHEFYIPLNLPNEVGTIIDLFNGLSCPYCQNRNINIDPTERIVLEE